VIHSGVGIASVHCNLSSKLYGAVNAMVSSSAFLPSCYELENYARTLPTYCAAIHMCIHLHMCVVFEFVAHTGQMDGQTGTDEQDR